jgi:Niemann-Pick C1 protein
VLVMAAISISRLRQLLVLYLLAVFVASTAADDGWTRKHEPGRCAIRGHCGKKSFFGKELPCPDNGLAEEPDGDVREKLVDICGDKWSAGPVCCRGDQVRRTAMPYRRI